MRGEREFIRLIEHRARRSSPDVVVGIGDDAALIVPKAECLLKVRQFRGRPRFRGKMIVRIMTFLFEISGPISRENS